MNPRRLATFAALTFPLLPLAARAQVPDAAGTPRYKWTPGQTLRYTLQRDPYFTDPARAIETSDPRAPERPPIVERLTERVLGVRPDGSATLRVSVGPEPGFEDGTRFAPPETLTVTPDGQITSPLPAGGRTDFLRAFFRLPEGPATPDVRGRAVFTRALPPAEAQSTSPDHDGTLLQTTRTTGTDRVVFDLAAGSVVRRASTLTVTVSLVMTKRGARGVADFGHVVPNVVSVQTQSIERRDDLPLVPPVPLVPADRPSRVSPSRALTGRQSKS